MYYMEAQKECMYFNMYYNLLLTSLGVVQAGVQNTRTVLWSPLKDAVPFLPMHPVCSQLNIPLSWEKQ